MTARLIGRISAEPWAIHGPALQTILEIASREPLNDAVLAEWKGHMSPRALATRPAQPLPNAERAQIRDGVAILQVSGPLFRYANVFTDMSGATSLATFGQDLQTAVSDQRVKAILLEIDSPGGEMTGMIEASAAIRAAVSVKPVVAYVEGLGASAAYQLAAACAEIVASPTAMLGCLGVVAAMMDRRAADARTGVTRHEFVSSQTPNKRPDPTTDAGRAAIQERVDRLGAAFLADVAAHRAMTVDELLAATKGGDLIVGADAIAVGLADRLGTFEQTMTRLAAGAVPVPRKPRPAPLASMEPSTMETPKDPATAAPVVPPASPAAEAPALVAPVAAQADAMTAERARCAAIQAAALPGFGKLSVQAMEEGWPAAQFIRAQAAAGEAVEAARAQAAGSAFATSFPPPVPAGAAFDVDASKLPPDERAKAEWAASETIRAEFGSVDHYAAFLRAEASGKVRILSRKG